MDEQLKLDKKYIQNNFGYALEEELKEPTKDNIVLNIVYKYLLTYIWTLTGLETRTALKIQGVL